MSLSELLQFQFVQLVLRLVLAFDNDKGGVGKTTNALHLAYFLKALGLHVVLADNDNNRCLTNWLLGKSFNPHSKGFRHILDVFLDCETLLTGALVEIDPDGAITQQIRAIMPAEYTRYAPGKLFLVPGAQSLYLAAKRFKPTAHVATPAGVLSYIANHPDLGRCHPDLNGHVDVFIGDNAPGFDEITLSMLLAAQKVIAPIEPANLSLDGLDDYLWRVDQANEQRGEARVPGRTNLDGVVISRLNTYLKSQSALAQKIPSALAAGNIYCYRSVIPETDGVFDAPKFRGPVWARTPDDPGAKALMEFCVEVTNRLIMARLRAAA